MFIWRQGHGALTPSFLDVKNIEHWRRLLLVSRTWGTDTVFFWRLDHCVPASFNFDTKNIEHWDCLLLMSKTLSAGHLFHLTTTRTVNSRSSSFGVNDNEELHRQTFFWIWTRVKKKFKKRKEKTKGDQKDQKKKKKKEEEEEKAEEEQEQEQEEETSTMRLLLSFDVKETIGTIAFTTELSSIISSRKQRSQCQWCWLCVDVVVTSFSAVTKCLCQMCSWMSSCSIVGTRIEYLYCTRGLL